MAHVTEIVEYKKLSDSEFAVLIRCCDGHLHWHTMHSSVVNEEAKLQESVEWARNLAAANHDAALQAEKALKELTGSKKEHL